MNNCYLSANSEFGFHVSEQLSRALLERYRPWDRTSRLLKGLAIRGNNRGKTGTTTICWHCFAVSIYTERSAIIPWNSESLIMCSISACGLQCYQCISTKSWDDCESVKTKVNCSSSENRCSKGYEDIKKGGVSVKDYAKGCSSADFCKTATDTDACKEGTCELDCCSGDLCNAATVPLVSAIIFTVCAVLATSL